MPITKWSADQRAISAWAVNLLAGYGVDTDLYDFKIAVNDAEKTARVEATKRDSNHIILIENVFYGVAGNEWSHSNPVTYIIVTIMYHENSAPIDPEFDYNDIGDDKRWEEGYED